MTGRLLEEMALPTAGSRVPTNLSAFLPLLSYILQHDLITTHDKGVVVQGRNTKGYDELTTLHQHHGYLSRRTIVSRCSRSSEPKTLVFGSHTCSARLYTTNTNTYTPPAHLRRWFISFCNVSMMFLIHDTIIPGHPREQVRQGSNGRRPGPDRLL